jgi:3'-phosphoadenosine 5'-phosphosulfate sulfotransferase (PAPS reductase)/FAD synthetase
MILKTNSLFGNEPFRHVVCYSGGESSALVAVEVARKFGAENTILLNHDIHPNSEDVDIKRFKNEVAAYLGISITYANMEDWDRKDQFDVVIEAGAFKVGSGTALCTHRMKTEPFEAWLRENFPNQEAIIYYGFDPTEKARMQRRSSHLATMGFRTDYPLATWRERSIRSIREVGIEPPLTYSTFKHANCTGCLKAGKQHWYVVYVTRPDIWTKAVAAEDAIGYSIHADSFLTDMEPLFERMKAGGIPATERIHQQAFWASVRALGIQITTSSQDEKPCECVI